VVPPAGDEVGADRKADSVVSVPGIGRLLRVAPIERDGHGGKACDVDDRSERGEGVGAIKELLVVGKRAEGDGRGGERRGEPHVVLGEEAVDGGACLLYLLPSGGKGGRWGRERLFD